MYRARVEKFVWANRCRLYSITLSDDRAEFATLGEALDFINSRVENVALVSAGDGADPKRLEVLLRGQSFLRLPPELNLFGKTDAVKLYFTADVGDALVVVDYWRDDRMALELAFERYRDGGYLIELEEPLVFTDEGEEE